MRTALTTVLVVVFLAGTAHAITWNFDRDGDAQGWWAAEGETGGAMSTQLSHLPSQVQDGVWRMPFRPFESSRNPSVRLVSPLLGFDSGLFDRIAIRLRLVGSRPLAGYTWFSWTNEANPTHAMSLMDGAIDTLLAVPQELTYTTQWQEVAVTDLSQRPTEMLGQPYVLLWAGELQDIRLEFVMREGSGWFDSPADWPEALEVDWITLTGVEEQLQGEIPPPVVRDLAYGDLFASSVFNPLGPKGLSNLPTLGYSNPNAALGDLDGDLDLDLVATYRTDDFVKGWLTAYNDGNGHFADAVLHRGWPAELQGADLDGDGRTDLVLTNERQTMTQVYRNDPEEGWVVAQEFPDRYLVALGDIDGDGAPDLWLNWLPTASADVPYLLLLNDGTGRFVAGQGADLVPAVGYWLTGLIPAPGGRGSLAMLWHSTSEPGYKITFRDNAGQLVQQPLDIELKTEFDWEQTPLHYVGDFDQDGDVDMMASEERLNDDLPHRRGLTFWINDGAGAMQRTTWSAEAEIKDNVLFVDLTGDGLLDMVYSDVNERDPAVMMVLGVPGKLPVPEGRYPLRGRGGAILGGDLDQDGDVDLMVLEQVVDGEGGVHVLLNQLSERRTDVAEEADQGLPTSFRLGPNYPNPFNPRTIIPFTMPAAATDAHLRVYDLLGQSIRILVHGPLSAGTHAVTWDGRDDLGRSMSSGVYLYRLEAGEWRASGKMVKEE